jgi:hypothetical protein
MRGHREHGRRWIAAVLGTAVACTRAEDGGAGAPGSDREVAEAAPVEASAVAEEESPASAATTTARDERPSARQAAGLDAPATRRRFTFTPRSLGKLDREVAATAAALASRFAKCEIIEGTYDHLGTPAPYFEVLCDHVVVFGVLGSPRAGSRTDGGGGPAIVGVRVLAREITPPSGFGVGARYVPLAELNPSLECRRAALPGAGDLFPKDSTICAAELAPNILYLFRGRSFSGGAPPGNVEALRIDELLWLPQASP